MNIIHSPNKLASIAKIEEEKYKLDKKPEFAKLPLDESEDNLKIDEIIYLAQRFYRELCKEQELDKKYKKEVKFDFITDAILNAELHGNKFDINKHTWITYSDKKTPEGKEITAVIEDEGDGFDYEHLLESEQRDRVIGANNTYNNFRKLHNMPIPEESMGYGLFGLIRFSDSVMWNEKGNIITIKKTLIEPKGNTEKQQIRNYVIRLDSI